MDDLLARDSHSFAKIDYEDLVAGDFKSIHKYFSQLDFELIKIRHNNLTNNKSEENRLF